MLRPGRDRPPHRALAGRDREIRELRGKLAARVRQLSVGGAGRYDVATRSLPALVGFVAGGTQGEAGRHFALQADRFGIVRESKFCYERAVALTLMLTGSAFGRLNLIRWHSGAIQV